MGGLGSGEIIVIMLVLLVLFGGSQLPKLARSLGQAQKELKKGMDEGLDEDEDETV
ncbi:MAG: twin-arginine translocase TatA/TatE family subunit [Acidobacteria bacterium]|nr:twin-arginine translocase TatA/TatE family subunit [Acidobacteriota bacterium]